MVLRLILVGIVASLGMSPPAESELAGWTCTVQTWLDARLAEGEARELRDEGAFATPAGAPAKDLSFEGAEDERKALAADASVADGSAPAEDMNTAAFEAVVDEMVAAFSQDRAAALARTPESPDATAGVADECADELADVGKRGDGAAKSVMSDEPLEGNDDLYPGLAYELNRQADGIDEPAPADDLAPVAHVSAGNRLSNAVRLTRDALYAWMNLLQSPAIVTIPR